MVLDSRFSVVLARAWIAGTQRLPRWFAKRPIDPYLILVLEGETILLWYKLQIVSAWSEPFSVQLEHESAKRCV